MPFDASEYEQRMARVQARMSAERLDVLLVTNPANMNYLTGFDAWSFYQPQAVVVSAALPSRCGWDGRRTRTRLEWRRG